MSDTTTLHVRRVPKELMRDLKILAATLGITLRQLVLDVLQESCRR